MNTKKMLHSLTVEAKLSSRRIMFAASLETSEPEMFIAIPRSAYEQHFSENLSNL